MNIRSTIIGTTLLVVLLTAGAAQSLSGSNTVFSDDIVDGTVTHADIKANSIGGSRLLDNAVTGGKILDSTVTGADVNESSLGTVPNSAAVNQVTIEPFERSFADGDATQHVYIVGSGASGDWVSFTCDAGFSAQPTRGASGPAMSYDLRHKVSGTEYTFAPTYLSLGGSFAATAVGMRWHVTVYAPTQTVEVDFTTLKQTNMVGSNDCFVRGIKTTYPTS